MSDKKEQEKPLAPAATRHIDIERSDAFSSEFMPHHPRKCIKAATRHIDIERSDAFSGEFMEHHRRKYIKCCGCFIAILLIIAMIILVLMLTVLHVKDPVLKMNSVYIKRLNSGTNFGPGSNLTVEADVSIKNPNVASFRFANVTTNLYYDGSVIGETTSPSGQAQARSTLQMSVLIDVMGDKMLGARGSIRLDMRIGGKVKITTVIKKSFVLEMNCTMNVNMSRQGIQDWNCKRVS